MREDQRRQLLYGENAPPSWARLPGARCRAVEHLTKLEGLREFEFLEGLDEEFFQALAMNGGMTLHVETLYGANNHHIAETCFKGLARALSDAVTIDPRQVGRVPSTKGTLSV